MSAEFSAGLLEGQALAPVAAEFSAGLLEGQALAPVAAEFSAGLLECQCAEPLPPAAGRPHAFGADFGARPGQGD